MAGKCYTPNVYPWVYRKYSLIGLLVYGHHALKLNKMMKINMVNTKFGIIFYWCKNQI